MILAADIGGTKVNLALFQQENNGLLQVDEARFESQKYSGLEDILNEFCPIYSSEIERAAFGIAGPVKEGVCDVTNLPWVVDVNRLKKFAFIE